MKKNFFRSKSIGVVIGVEQYKDIAPAPFASNDAVVMEQYFKNILGIEQVIVLNVSEMSKKLSGAQTPKFYSDDDQVLVEFK
ncbi:MAG: hypothetical protein WAV76_16670 [Bacteroidota bacterium]